MKPLVNQLTLADISPALGECFIENPPKLIELFKSSINLNEIIPYQFHKAYYKNTGHPRDFKLTSMLSALIIQKILSIPQTSLLINILKLSKELRELCGFTNVPNTSQFTRFKKDFLNELYLTFNNLVDKTKPICKDINSYLSDILIVDTTGLEGKVKENNPKFFDTLFRNAKKLSKNNSNFNSHAFACSRMPKHSFINEELKFSFMNGHYCYAFKTAFVTNGLGIIQHIDFYNKDAIEISEAKSANEYKDEYDSKTLIPVLNNFFHYHPTFSYKYFLGDAGFDSMDNYRYLVSEKSMIPIIPLNLRNSKDLSQPTVNDEGIPLCPCDISLPMIFDGSCKEKNRPLRLKWICPKTHKIYKNGKTTYECNCKNPFTKSKSGRIHHTYPRNNFRLNTVVPRNSELWTSLYKIRTIIERSIYMVKHPMSVARSNLFLTESIKADVLLAGITQHITLLIAAAVGKVNRPLSIKQLTA